MRVILANLWERVRTGYWLMPGAMTVTVFILWVFMLWIDNTFHDQLAVKLTWLYSIGPEGVREVLSATVGSVITVTGVIFSVTIVALTLASQQFGPRLLRHFMRDTGNQVVLGFFISTFLYCLLVLLTIRGPDETTYVPHISVSFGVLLTITSMGFLIYFIHHVASIMQAPRIVAAVSRELLEGIENDIGGECKNITQDGRSPEVFTKPENFEQESTGVQYAGCGYIQSINFEYLTEIAEENDLVIQMQFRPGDFLMTGSTIVRAWPGHKVDERIRDNIKSAVTVGIVRTPTQDLGFLFDELSEVAVRSLSPSVNDPFTAMNCIDHLAEALIQLGKKSKGHHHMVGTDGKVRIIARRFSFGDAANKSFDHVRQYSTTSGPVTNHLLDTIFRIAEPLSFASRELFHQADMIREGSKKLEQASDRRQVALRYRAISELRKAKRK